MGEGWLLNFQQVSESLGLVADRNFFFFFSSETGFLCVALAVLELTL
jgi:hypothetical protein